MEKDISETHLYFIRDRLSHVPETAVIQSVNDAVAVRGFSEFLKKNDELRKEQNLPLIAPIERELVHICALDKDNRILIPTDKSELNEWDYRVVCNGENVDSYLEEIHNGLRGE